MNNDLISREALKEEFKRSANSVRNWKEGALNSGNEESAIRADAVLAYLTEVKGIIDNAQTVAYPFEKFRTMLCGTCQAYMRIAPERPQGEWIFLKANEEQTDGYECSVCKTTYHTRVPYFSEYNFCPNCGASMKKGGAE